jgi:hypothetical protein
MHPLFLDEINAQQIEDRVRAARKAARSSARRPHHHLRTAFGVRLVRLGLRLVTTDGSSPTLAPVDGPRH